ncbi:hypothetical protein ACFQE8_07170 [Salinirubellus sp. GCM10025818]|uniref:hypothetical protein n=1 Tax=Salinirubellus TaxID=2162630 RepID=UPI0030CE4217
MRLFDFDPERSEVEADALQYVAAETEWELESWLNLNPHVILDEPLLVFGRQYALDTGFLDLLALDQWGNVVVVELKKGKSGSGSASEETILSQPQNYAQSLSRYEYEALDEIYTAYKDDVLADKWEVGHATPIADSLLEAHQEFFGGDVAMDAFNQHQRMVILAEEITPRTESNARYLLEQGLAVQCVEVRRFVDQSGDSFLVSSTVVDYPLSRVRPKRSSADFSDLTGTICDRLAPRVTQQAGITTARSTGTKVKVESSTPPGLWYEVYLPGNEAGREAQIRLNASEVDDSAVKTVRAALQANAHDGDPYRVNESGVNDLAWMEPITVSASRAEDIDMVADACAGLVEWAQPVLLAAFDEEE